jgi:hypothetical protein
MNYEQKYLKYKNKYLLLKEELNNQIGGVINVTYTSGKNGLKITDIPDGVTMENIIKLLRDANIPNFSNTGYQPDRRYCIINFQTAQDAANALINVKTIIQNEYSIPAPTPAPTHASIPAPIPAPTHASIPTHAHIHAPIPTNKYNSKHLIYENGGRNMTSSIYVKINIDPDSFIGQEISHRRNESETEINTLTNPYLINKDIEPHVSLLEIFFDPNTILGHIILRSFINNSDEIFNIIKDSFKNNLENKSLHSEMDEYSMMSNFFARNYESISYYKEFKIEIYRMLCSLIGIDYRDLFPPEEIHSNGINFYKFNKSKPNIDYSISQFYYNDGWIPHLSLIKFDKNTKIIEGDELFNNVKVIFKSKARHAMSYINLWNKNKGIIKNEKNIKGSIKNIKVILNHPDYSYGQYSKTYDLPI